MVNKIGLNMKKLLLLISFFVVFAKSKAQNQKKIEVAKLVKVAETSDFPGLVKLVEYLSYWVVDSSKQADGSLIYITSEKKINGNILGCTVNSRYKINHVNFSTYDVNIYVDIKKQIKDLGFKSSGISKGNFSEIVEAEDFEKGKMLIGIAARKDKEDKIEYEFTFMMW
jgi:hypothetical protein